MSFPDGRHSDSGSSITARGPSPSTFSDVCLVHFAFMVLRIDVVVFQKTAVHQPAAGFLFDDSEDVDMDSDEFEGTLLFCCLSVVIILLTYRQLNRVCWRLPICSQCSHY